MKERSSIWLPLGILASIGGGMLWWTWGTWLHPVIDFGRELYVPWRITEGDVLFRDLAWFNGPLSQYWNAFLFQCFGVGLRTLVVGNAVIFAVFLWLLYGLLRRVSDTFTATIATATAMLLSGFGQYDAVANFNWICPYSHELTHGVVLTFVVLRLLDRWLRRPSHPTLVAAGFAAGCVFLTKPEVFAACALAVVTFLALSRKLQRPFREMWPLAAAAIPPLIACVLLATAMPIGDAVSAVLGGWRHVGNPQLGDLRFYEYVQGTDDPTARVTTMLLWLAVWSFAIAVVVFVHMRLRGGARRVVSWLIAVGLASFAFADSRLGVLFAPLPILLAGCVALAFRRWRRADRAEDIARSAIHGILLIFSIGLLAKIGLHVVVAHYGFVLAMPGLCLLQVALFSQVPAALRRFEASPTGMRIAFLGIPALFVAWALPIFDREMSRLTHTIGHGADAFRTDAGRGPILDHVALTFASFAPSTKLLVVPEGIMINYLARRANPTPFVNFMPPELIMFGEDRMLAALEASPPDSVVVIGRTTQEYGLPLFGRDYGKSIYAWIRRRYTPVREAQFGPEPLVPERLKDRVWSLWVLDSTK